MASKTPETPGRAPELGLGLGFVILIAALVLVFAMNGDDVSGLDNLGERIANKLKSVQVTAEVVTPSAEPRSRSYGTPEKDIPKDDLSAVECDGPPEAIVCRFINQQ